MSQWLRNHYQVDTDAELDTLADMLAANYKASMNILNNPDKFPRANLEFVEKSADEHFIYLAAMLHPVILAEMNVPE